MSNCYCFRIVNWRKAIFFFIYDYISKQWLIFQLVQLVYLFFVTMMHGEPEAYSMLWRSPKGNWTYKMLQYTYYNLTEEVWKGRYLKKDYQRIPNTMYTHNDTGNKRNSSTAHSCTHNCEDEQIKQCQVLNLETISWLASFFSTVSVCFI